jgi:hypothetical protein
MESRQAAVADQLYANIKEYKKMIKSGLKKKLAEHMARESSADSES